MDNIFDFADDKDFEANSQLLPCTYPPRIVNETNTTFPVSTTPLIPANSIPVPLPHSKQTTLNRVLPDVTIQTTPPSNSIVVEKTPLATEHWSNHITTDSAKRKRAASALPPSTLDTPTKPQSKHISFAKFCEWQTRCDTKYGIC